MAKIFVNTQMDKDLAEKLEKMADEEMLNRSNFIRRLIGAEWVRRKQRQDEENKYIKYIK